MGAKSRIEWTDATWTPIRARRRDTGKVGVHCERVSPGCKNCYSATFNRRGLPVHGTGLDFTVRNRDLVEIFLDEDMEFLPLRWKRPRKIFVCSQTDLFAAFVPRSYIVRVVAVMALADWHTFQILTKREERMFHILTSEDFWDDVALCMACLTGGEIEGLDGIKLPKTGPEVGPDTPLPHVWFGVSVEDQPTADERILWLLRTPAAKRFISYEPALGAVNLRRILWDGHSHYDALTSGLDNNGSPLPRLDWVIAGGESGPKARPAHPAWFRDVRDQCQQAGVPFFFKQWGEWGAVTFDDRNGKIVPNERKEAWAHPDGLVSDRASVRDFAWPMVRVGKKKAGRLLDGREWSEFPS